MNKNTNFFNFNKIYSANRAPSVVIKAQLINVINCTFVVVYSVTFDEHRTRPCAQDMQYGTNLGNPVLF